MKHHIVSPRDQDLAVQVPAIVVPPSVMYAHPSRMIDAWMPAVEQIHLPEFTIPASTIRMSVTWDCETFDKLPSVPHLTPFAQLKRGIRRTLSKMSTSINMQGHLILDCRGKDANNIAHIIHDILLRVQIARDLLAQTEHSGEKIVVVLPKRVSQLTSQVFDYLEIPTLITDGPVKGNTIQFLKDGEPIQEVVYGLLPGLSKMPIPNYIQNTPLKVFISRKDTRKIINEREVEEYLSSQGFEKLYFDELAFEEQWSISRNATDIVAIHGAALGSIAFNRRRRNSETLGNSSGLRLTELFSAAFVVDPFRRFIAALGGNWAGVRGQISPEIVKDLDYEKMIFRHAYDPFRVDLTSLCMALEEQKKRC